MGLTDDQKAMLRLLAQREEGYDGMAALMGISPEEVREKVKEALSEVDAPEDTSPEAAEPLTPPPPPPSPQAPASPGAEALAPLPPSQTTADTPPPAEPRRTAKRPPKLSLPKLPENRGPALGIAAGALAVVVLVIILIVGGSGGGNSPSSSASSGSSGETAPTAAEERNLTQAILTPVAGGDGSGKALFGRFQKKVLLQVEAEGLEPSPKGSTYTIWLYRSPKLALQIGSIPVGSSGKIAAQFQIPAQLLGYVANGAFDQVDVALTPTAAYRAAFAKAKAERQLPSHVGESVLRGEITGPAIR